jgi:hypothetical protein
MSVLRPHVPPLSGKLFSNFFSIHPLNFDADSCFRLRNSRPMMRDELVKRSSLGDAFVDIVCLCLASQSELTPVLIFQRAQAGMPVESVVSLDPIVSHPASGLR